PRTGCALHLGFDRTLDAVGETLSLHIWTRDWQTDAQIRARLMAEYAAFVASVSKGCAPPRDWRLHYRVETIWEYYGGGDSWLPLKNVTDETRALSLTGFVRFDAPINHQAGGPGPGFFIRCRITSGRFECPPQLTHVAFNAVPCEHALSMEEQ